MLAKWTPLRTYKERKREAKDVDAAERAFDLKIRFWATTGGGFLGSLLGMFLGVGPIVGFLGGSVFVYVVTRTIMASSAKVMGQIYHPSGKSTPPKREHSRAQSLAARGLYKEAADAFQRACAEYPDDPEPCFMLARMYRYDMERYEDAVTWYRKARAVAEIDPGRDLLASQEIIDIYIQKLSEPRRALPELARLVDRFPGTPAADLAGRQLAQIRQQMREEQA